MLKRDESEALSMNYAEYMVKTKREGSRLIKTLITCVLFAALFVFLTWAVCGGIVYLIPVEFLVIFGCLFGCILITRRFKPEYEYIVAAAQIEFDVIYGQKSRKTICTVNLDDAERIAPVNESTRAYLESHKSARVIDCSSSKNSKRRYFVLAKVDGNETIVYFDAIAKTLDVLRFFRRNIVEIDQDIYNM